MNPKLYPQSLLDIMDVIGEDAGLILLDNLAGTRLFIPKEMKPTNRLVELIGMDLAETMARTFSGETISVPRAARARREMRNIAIREAYDGGERVPDIGQRVELTERQVYAILAQADVPG